MKGEENCIKLVVKRGVATEFLETAEVRLRVRCCTCAPTPTMQVGDIVGIAGLDRAANVTDTITTVSFSRIHFIGPFHRHRL